MAPDLVHAMAAQGAHGPAAALLVIMLAVAGCGAQPGGGGQRGGGGMMMGSGGATCPKDASAAGATSATSNGTHFLVFSTGGWQWHRVVVAAVLAPTLVSALGDGGPTLWQQQLTCKPHLWFKAAAAVRHSWPSAQPKPPLPPHATASLFLLHVLAWVGM